MIRLDDPRWIALFPAVYFVHLADERYFWIGTANFATQYLGIYFTNLAWWIVNIPSLALMGAASVLIARRIWPAWLVIALAIHLALHGLGRVPTSLWTGEIAPGLISGLLLCSPLALVTLARGVTHFEPAELRRGVVAGVASFQPLWHFVLLPFLPGVPPPT